MALLARSGLHPLSWSGYGFWVPQRFASLGDTFNWRFALQGVAEFGRGPGGEPVPHLLFCLRVLGGLPGLREGSGLGPWWPLAGWLAAGYLGWTARQPSRASAGAQAPQKAQGPEGSGSQEAQGPQGAQGAQGPQGPQGAHDGKGLLRQVTAALAIFAGGYLVLYSFYFFPSARFLLPPLLIPAGSLAVLCGLGLARGRALPGAAALAGLLLVLAVTAGELSERRRASGGTAAAADPEEETRELFYWWVQLPEWRRARRMVPFDPVEAQSLGLLPPAVARSIRVWGELPPTVHVRRLQGMGLIPRLPELDGRAK